MSIAIPTATRIQDMYDVSVAPSAGVDRNALAWDNGVGKFVLRSMATALTFAVVSGGEITTSDGEIVWQV